jgi:hypothetical protein
VIAYRVLDHQFGKEVRLARAATAICAFVPRWLQKRLERRGRFDLKRFFSR